MATTSPLADPDMHPHIRALAENLRSVISQIDKIAGPTHSVRLVAVSKLKPASDVLALYNENGHRHFGENYVQELLDKSSQLPRDIRWHFIGQLQTNKCRLLAERIPNLWAVESVDTIKKATALEKGRTLLASSAADVPNERVRIFVQVNTSGEEGKSGCSPQEATVICKHIRDSCPHLQLQGLMTIGSLARSIDPDHENQDFILLNQVAEHVSEQVGMYLELSMGMSNDFEEAVRLGATSVRVGTTIFGQRPPKS